MRAYIPNFEARYKLYLCDLGAPALNYRKLSEKLCDNFIFKIRMIHVRETGKLKEILCNVTSLHEM